jgi:maleate isomerase
MRHARLRIGVLTPHAAVGPEEEFAAMAPVQLVTRVARVTGKASDATNDPPATPDALRALTAPAVLEHAAETLLREPVDAVAYASTTSAYAIGFDAETAMVSRLARRLDVPVVSTCVSAVLALRVLGTERLALIGAPWFDPELNDLGAAYFRSQGFDVVSSRSPDLSEDPAQIESGAVVEWTAQHVEDEAEAIFIGGNGFRVAPAINRLETTLGRPVLSSNQALFWNLLAHLRASAEVSGYGRLFAHTFGR